MSQTQGTSTTQATLAQILSALQNRRTAASYSTAYHHNECALTLSRSVLTTQAPTAFLLQNPTILHLPSSFSTSSSPPTALLYRIVANATTFSLHYQTQVKALQARQAKEDCLVKRKAMVVSFESGHGSGAGRDVDVGSSLAARVVERRGKELEDELRKFVGAGGPLTSHPVSTDLKVIGNQQECKFCVEEVVCEPVEKADEKTEKGESLEGVIDGVDRDMIVAFWDQY